MAAWCLGIEGIHQASPGMNVSVCSVHGRTAPAPDHNRHHYEHHSEAHRESHNQHHSHHRNQFPIRDPEEVKKEQEEEEAVAATDYGTHMYEGAGDGAFKITTTQYEAPVVS